MSHETRTRQYIFGVIVGLLICLAPYVGCYLLCGDSRQDNAGTFRCPATIRSYRCTFPQIFAPAAWVEANITGRTVVIGEDLGPMSGPGFSCSGMVLFRWIVDPRAGIGRSQP